MGALVIHRLLMEGHGTDRWCAARIAVVQCRMGSRGGREMECLLTACPASAQRHPSELKSFHLNPLALSVLTMRMMLVCCSCAPCRVQGSRRIIKFLTMNESLCLAINQRSVGAGQFPEPAPRARGDRGRGSSLIVPSASVQSLRNKPVC